MSMTIHESINRGFNLLATSIAALAGLAFAPEIFVEADHIDKLDDGLLLIIGLAALGWYNTGRRATTRSVVPFIMVALSCLVKIAGLIIEFGDPESAGDDFGGVILFVLAVALVAYQWVKTKKLLAQQ